jgi:hypothetical protein
MTTEIGKSSRKKRDVDSKRMTPAIKKDANANNTTKRNATAIKAATLNTTSVS